MLGDLVPRHLSAFTITMPNVSKLNDMINELEELSPGLHVTTKSMVGVSMRICTILFCKLAEHLGIR